ncbi:hypothetical protein RUM44_013435 [Polyplax serrata]|uniref:Uncharacterized protein n=1 Tax=Polyplax serrata TaxID=468196 RepID=A0ABR1BIF8_POLSC
MDRFSIQSVVEIRSQVRPQEKNQMEDNNTDIKETARIGGRQEGCQCRIGKSGHPVVNLLTTPSGGAVPSAGGEMSKLSEHQRPSSATSESLGVTSGTTEIDKLLSARSKGAVDTQFVIIDDDDDEDEEEEEDRSEMLFWILDSSGRTSRREKNLMGHPSYWVGKGISICERDCQI